MPCREGVNRGRCRAASVWIPSIHLVGTGLLALLSAPPCGAQTFEATVDRYSLSTDDVLYLTVSLSLGGNDTASEPRLEPSDEFTVVGPAQREDGYSIVNMQVSRSIRWIFALRPRRAGSLTVPAAQVTVNRRTLKTAPIKVEVTAGTGAGASGARGPLPSPTPSAPTRPAFEGDREFAIVCRPDKTSVYVGEQLTVDVEYYTTFRPSGSLGRNGPRAEGFLAERLPSPDPDYVTVNDRQYARLVSRWALFATAPGRYSISATPEEVMVPPLYTAEKITSNAAVVTVKPLPSAPAGMDFSGAVGELSVHLSCDKTAVKAGEGLTVKVVVEGTGNLQAMKRPRLRVPGWCKVYDSGDQRSIEPRESGGTTRLGGRVEFGYLIVPRRAGSLQIPPVALSYFRPSKADYATAVSEGLTVQVAPGVVTEDTDGANGGPALRHIHTRGARLHARTSLLATPVVWLVPLLCVIAVGVAWWRRQQEDRRRSDPQTARALQAQRAATRALARLAEESGPNFLPRVGEVVCRYLSDRLALPATGITATELHRGLIERGVAAPVADAARDLLQLCQASRYAPSGAATPSPDETLRQARELIAAVERGGGER